MDIAKKSAHMVSYWSIWFVNFHTKGKRVCVNRPSLAYTTDFSPSTGTNFMVSTPRVAEINLSQGELIIRLYASESTFFRKVILHGKMP